MRIEIKNSNGGNILEYLRDNNIRIPAACGGRGTCGKCKVRIPHEVLACETKAEDGFVVEYQPEGSFRILDAYTPQRDIVCDMGAGLAVAIDIGTTTLAFELLDRATGERLAAHTAVNRQRSLGADVISRIGLAASGRQDELQKLIIDDLRDGVKRLIQSCGVNAGSVPSEQRRVTPGSAPRATDIAAVAIAGNTTMLHILRGYPLNSLGVYPFTPVSVEAERIKLNADLICQADPHFAVSESTQSELCFISGGADVTLLPGISGFVGADITAGIIFGGIPGGGAYDLLIDLGTNGEMALYNNERIIVSSAAAGPAFEAGNISCGVGGIPGAVARVTYLPNERVYAYKTINDEAPVGLCGTGVVDTVAQLALHGVIDETGLLDDEFFDDGVEIAPGVVFTQKDVREVQLAKSAVRAGIEILTQEAGIGFGSVRRLLLAGGFGHKINIESACVLGIIPRELADRVVAVGNSSLGGAARVVLNRASLDEAIAVSKRAKEINLSAHPRFNDLFMEYMMFGG
jgi:uncharacterized 2Fe-2S/4Fe-4S cluster protein (DUF4445 family)